MTDITDATIAEIEQALEVDGVWVAPAFAKEHGVTEADESAIEEAVASAKDANVNVVLIDIDSEDDRFQGNFANLSAWLHDDAGGDLTYVGWERWATPNVTVHTFGAQPEARYVADVAAAEHPDDMTAQLVRVPELIDAGNARALWEEIPRGERYPSADEGVQASEVFGGLGVLVGLGALAAGFLAWRRRHRRKPSGFTLPRTVLHTVRAAEDRRLRADADAKVLALGEALGAGEPTGSANSLAAWQAALDHYAAASSILAQSPAPADVVGALVLARRGEDARATAQQPAPSVWRPPVGCWFNPLHEGSTTKVTWRDGDREVTVPACEPCAASARTGQEPEDILDFIEDDRTVHYFRLDLGAWTQTGYGTVETDLLGALNASAAASSTSRRAWRGRTAG